VFEAMCKTGQIGRSPGYPTTARRALLRQRRCLVRGGDRARPSDHRRHRDHPGRKHLHRDPDYWQQRRSEDSPRSQIWASSPSIRSSVHVGCCAHNASRFHPRALRRSSAASSDQPESPAARPAPARYAANRKWRFQATSSHPERDCVAYYA